MSLFAENIPENRRELVGLELEAHIRGALEDEILRLAHLGDAGEITLDIGRKHRHPGAGESLGHHLQRHGFSGSGGAGDETMAIGKPERQPRPRFALADEYLLVGIAHTVVGRCHRIASSRIRGVCSPRAVIILHLASLVKPPTQLRGAETASLQRDRTGSGSVFRPGSEQISPSRQYFCEISSSLLHCCNTRLAIEGESTFARAPRL